jgi:hypothetical protein
MDSFKTVYESHAYILNSDSFDDVLQFLYEGSTADNALELFREGYTSWKLSGGDFTMPVQSKQPPAPLLSGLAFVRASPRVRL